MHTLNKSDGAYQLASVETLRYGLRWEPVKAERKGILGKAERKIREQQGLTDPADWDAGAVFLSDGDPKKYLGFNNFDPFKDEPTDQERKSARHSGDSVRGTGDGDDEQIDLDLPRIPRRYDSILLVGGAYKTGAQVAAVRDVKATIYDGTGGAFEAVGEYEPSLLGVKRMIAIARLTRVNGLWSLSIVNESYDIQPGDFRSLLHGAMRVS